jgi:hypothetical protein
MLSLLTTRERAASMVGDLAEDSAWFWVSFLRIWIGMVWHDFAADWERLIGQAALALLIQFALIAVGIMAFAFALGIAIGIAGGLLSSAIGGDFHVPRWALATLRWGGSAAGLAITAVVQVRVGRWLARRCPGHEIAACFAVMLVGGVAGEAITLMAGFPTSFSAIVSEWTVGWVPSLLLNLPLFFGAVRVRSRF